MRAVYGLALIGLLAAVGPARSEIWHYRLDVAPRVPQTSSSLTLHCSENAICQSKIDLVIEGKSAPVTVSALFVPGSAYIRFDAGDTPLFIGGQRYFHMPLGRTRRASASVPVNQPTPQALADRESRLVLRPVERAPAAYVAIVDLDVRPDD
jgi:hypothetical protein